MRKSAIQWLDDLRAPNKRVAHRATLKLGGLGTADAWMAAQLVAAIDEGDEHRRFWAIIGLSCLARKRALGITADDVCRRLIAVARTDRAFGIRQAALMVLARCPKQGETVVPAIVGVVRNDADTLVREEGIRALTTLRRAAASAAEFLISALNDRDASVACHAAIALKFVPLKEPSLVRAVIRASKTHPDPAVRSQLEAAVRILRRRGAARSN